MGAERVLDFPTFAGLAYSHSLIHFPRTFLHPSELRVRTLHTTTRSCFLDLPFHFIFIGIVFFFTAVLVHLLLSLRFAIAPPRL